MKNNMLNMIGLAVALAMSACSTTTQEEVVPARTNTVALVSSDALASATTNAAFALQAENMAGLELIIEVAEPGDKAILYLDKDGALELREVGVTDLQTKDAQYYVSSDQSTFAKYVDALLKSGKAVKAKKLENGSCSAIIIG